MISAVKQLSTILLLAMSVTACRQELQLSGPTMGTTWSARVLTDEDSQQLQKEIQLELDRIENIFSTWRAGSEVSLINYNPTTDPIAISNDLYIVLNVALQVANASDGAFDPTLNALIETSGFGMAVKTDTSPQTIASLKKHAGWQKIKTWEKDGKFFLQKSDPLTSLNLNAVDQGYGADAIYKLLKTRKINDFLVDVGGEMRSAGLNKNDEFWKIGVQWPEPEKSGIYKIMKITEMAIATSGGYRDFKKRGSELSIHILDPTTGSSVKNDILSVTIINPNCTYADALATAVTVLGREKGLQLIKKFKYTDALILFRNGDGIGEFSTPGMKSYLEAVKN